MPWGNPQGMIHSSAREPVDGICKEQTTVCLSPPAQPDPMIAGPEGGPSSDMQRYER